MAALSLLIVDDNPRFLDASSALLQQGGLEVVGVASTTAEAVARAEELRPDVVLVDIHLSEESGFDLVRELHARMPTAEHRVILMSTHAEADFAELISTSPVDGFVPKDALSVQAIRQLLANA
jgi:DNA-binding NarL/FixJ family response regulator